jgi:RND family efflux transporter MFP subunit
MPHPSRVLFVSAFFLLIAACKEEAPPPRPEVARPAKLFTVEAPGANYVRSFPGEVQATDEAELAFRVGGELVEFPATRGLQVQQGDLLARLDDADYRAAVDQAQAQYDLAKSQFDRAAELVERQLVSLADYDQKNAMMKVRQSNLTRARNNLDYTRLIAPFDGVVARRLAENFESVAAGQVVLVLQTGDMVDVIVDVPESIVARMERTAANRNPRPVSVSFDSASDQVFEAHYKEHETQADPATLTYKVTVSLPVPDDINILPGMTATVTADLAQLFEGESDGYLAPIEAVFAAEDAPLDSNVRYVWKVNPDSMRATRANVNVGALTGDSIVVLEGLQEGDLLVVAGVNSVTEGMLLRPMTREAGL